jgi:hypothetical protein
MAPFHPQREAWEPFRSNRSEVAAPVVEPDENRASRRRRAKRAKGLYQHDLGEVLAVWVCTDPACEHGWR